MALSDQQTSEKARGAAPTVKRTRPIHTRRIIALVALTLLLVLLVLALRVALPAWRGYQAADDLLTTVRGGISSASAPALEDAILRADAALVETTDAMAPFYPLLRGLNFVPTWGGTVAATPELAALGRTFSAMAAEVAPVMEPALEGESMLVRGAALADSLAADPERIERLAHYAEVANFQLQQVPVEQLHPRIAGLLQEVGPLMPLLPDLLRALPGMPALLGMDEPHTYLVLVQNNHELRATGGFITAVGTLTLDQGNISTMEFDDSYAIFNRASQYPPAPQPMESYMGIPYLVFRDSNWSPDLPTTSQIARALYTMDTGAQFDDVVTIDLYAVQRLIGALGPLHLENVEEAVTGDNIIEIVKILWAQPADADVSVTEDLGAWWRERKNFIPALAKAALAKVLGGDADYATLANAAVVALDNREIQLYTQTPTVSELFAEMGWDGALSPPQTGDFLALVDTNMGYNKANAGIERALAYTVTPPASAGELATATLTVTYTHTIDAEDPGCDQTPRYGKTYDDMIARCFFNYARLYTPAGSHYLDLTGTYAGTITSQPAEKATHQFAGYFVLPPGESKTLTFTYTLPADVSEQLASGTYTLRIQRQSGSGALPVTLHIGDETTSALIETGLFAWAQSAPLAASE